MNELHDLIATRGAKFFGVERLDNLIKSMIKVADAQDAFRANYVSVAGDSKLSPDGKRDENRRHLGTVTVKYLANAAKVAASLREDLAGWENRLVPPPPDKDDSASAAVRSQIRERVNAMAAPQRIAFLGQTDLPRDVFAALLEGPAFLSGLDNKQRANVLQNYRSTYHAADVAQIATAHDAVELHDAISSIATNNATKVGGFLPHEFAAFVKEKGE
jgi:hypothetical protein